MVLYASWSGRQAKKSKKTWMVRALCQQVPVPSSIFRCCGPSWLSWKGLEGNLHASWNGRQIQKSIKTWMVRALCLQAHAPSRTFCILRAKLVVLESPGGRVESGLPKIICKLLSHGRSRMRSVYSEQSKKQTLHGNRIWEIYLKVHICS